MRTEIGFLQRMLRLAAATEAAILPRRCPFCGTSLHGSGLWICNGCLLDLPRIDCGCERCGLPLAAATGAACAGCQARPLPFARVIAPYLYEFPLSAAIRAYKYRRKPHYQPAFAALMLAASEALPNDLDAVQPVPLHRLRMLQRGFNQARELALPVARQLGLPLLDAVRRSRHTPYQSGLALAERQRNLDAAFALRRPVTARHVLLVDDVMTTGSTVGQLASLLLGNGVQRVSVLALARAVSD